MAQTLPESTKSFMISFGLGFFLQMSRFWRRNEGKFIRFKLNSSINPKLLNAGKTFIPNIKEEHYLNFAFFKEYLQSNIIEISNELFSFIVSSFKDDDKFQFIYSEDDNSFKEITIHREDVLLKIAQYFGVVILIFEPGTAEPRMIRDDSSPKVSISLEYSNSTFRSVNYAREPSSYEDLLNYPYYIDNKPHRSGAEPDPAQKKKVLENFFKLLVEAVDSNKNFMTDNERNEAIDVLMFDRSCSDVRNKLISVKVCNHNGRFGVFTCKHFHCYSCLVDDIQKANGDTSALKCPCEKPYSTIDIEAALSGIIN